MRVVAVNRKASFLYSLDSRRWEAGIVLIGPEVKALRSRGVSIAEAYVAVDKALQPFIYNLQIPRVPFGRYPKDYDPKRAKLLLLHKREIKKMRGKAAEPSCTLIPLKLFFNEAGWAKVEISLARGKATHEKRFDMKKRDWERHKGRLMRKKV